PPFPFSPVGFSELIDLVLAFDRRYRLSSPTPSPLKGFCWAKEMIMETRMTTRVRRIFFIVGHLRGCPKLKILLSDANQIAPVPPLRLCASAVKIFKRRGAEAQRRRKDFLEFHSIH